MIFHNCKTCAKLSNQPCYYLNIKRLRKEKGEDCPYWTPKNKSKSNFIQEVKRKLKLWR